LSIEFVFEPVPIPFAIRVVGSSTNTSMLKKVILSEIYASIYYERSSVNWLTWS